MSLDKNSMDHVVYSPVINNQEKLNRVPTIGARHYQCFLYFMILFIGFGFRVNLSVAIVAMVDPKASSNPDIPTYPEWTHKGEILSAFFWGYIWPQVIAGYVANRFGAKWFLVATMGVQSAAGFCTPFVASRFGEMGLMALRAFQGFCQGFFFPSVAAMLSVWVPREERSSLASLTFGAVPSGTVVGMMVTGLISATQYGWPMIFYIYGALGVLTSILLGLTGYNTPAEHPRIGEAEKLYIESSLGNTDEKPHHSVPWKEILASKHVWALITAQCGSVFAFWVLLTQIPTYMSVVLNLDIKNNSILSSLPYLVLYLLSIIMGFLSDFLINKGIFKQTVSRKVFNSIGTILPIIALIMMGYVKSGESTKVIWLLIVAVGSNAITGSGWSLNHMDLSPNYSGTVMGLCNGLSTIFSISAPLTVQYLVKDIHDPVQWRIIFFLTAGFQVFAAIIFVIFGSAEVQPWNEKTEEPNDSKNN
ncbi:unnamed protein product [Ceutorhynchus assimilis]|uniref:Putative inorganic phosphate cotransporter n=1 Tax=Ceutorhynchus assimilis TaxID=467358 RepID=A0A9N9MC92_9CUCU|nr:unnamed protein product [Ceutorhynchus assimilis]